MTTMIKLTADDGKICAAAVAGDPATAKGGIVILQEIFGLNSHILDLPRRYADAGYYAVAPALFDRAEPGVQLDYTPEGKTRGFALKQAVDAESIRDVAAAIAAAAIAGPVAVIGFCWGGSLAWRSAVELDGVAAAISYYGGDLPKRADEHAACPVLAHFGERDAGIPMDGVTKFMDAQAQSVPPVTTHIYDADHGFNCDARSQFDAAASALAHERSLAFLATHIG